MADRMKKKLKLRYNEYYDMQKELDELYAKSVRNENFYKLYGKVTSDENIRLALRKLSKNSGSQTPGVDRLTIDDLLVLPDETVRNTVKNKLENYAPQKVRRVDIEKEDGKTRPLGIPTIWDRLIQQCLLQVLEPICEAKFHPQSYGFRNNMSCENAVSVFYLRVNKSHLFHVVNIDVKGFFENVNHGKILRQMWSMGIRDKRIISIISKILKAEVAEIGFPEKGTPQGGIISPLLANIVLNELDWWLSSQWATFPASGEGSNRYRSLRNSRLKKMFHIRYADDIKIMCGSKDEASSILIATQKWLQERLSLRTSERKTHITDIRKQYSSFLGFEIKAIRKGKNADGSNRYVASSRVQPKEIIRIHRTAQTKLKSIKYAKDDKKRYQIVNSYNSFVIGTHNYYQYAIRVAEDFATPGYKIQRLLRARYKNSLRKSNGIVQNKYIQQRYGKSRGLLLYNEFPIVPLTYVKHKNPMGCNRKINQYTKEGRELIHKKLENIDMEILHYLMRNPVREESFEYNDNRISLYCAQLGRCAITKEKLTIGDIHCHHKIPRFMGGTDKYANLMLIKEDVHILIGATRKETIERLLSTLKLDRQQLQKLNELRVKMGNNTISFEL